ncbi:carbohydrate ABC transporter permease [Haloarchaeobius salinus]|uniref:carbohydrate ABC transporter permease n=1 Tax=Haloarchaeobius salinus TaxID=1198298 RepID=UPI00210C4270|nr:sugar ABC transporter permease [Haloarchaeobius salinus]
MDAIRSWLRRRRSNDGSERELRTDGGATGAPEREEGLVARYRRSDAVRSAPFWLPAFLLVGLFVYGAIFWNILISLTDYSGLGDPEYGSFDLDNYGRLLSETGSYSFTNAFVNTVILLIAFTLICLAFGLVVAILVDRDIRYENTFRTIYLLPMSLSFVVTAKMWLWMFSSDGGLVNVLLGVVGIGPIDFIRNPDPNVQLAAVTFALIWQFSGYAMVVYLAGLRAIPDEHFEAARVDGASLVRMYWRVIIPQLRTATVSASVVLMVFALKAFDFLRALYGSSTPSVGTDILATKMVRVAFDNNQVAYGSAIAVVLFVMAFSIVTPYLYSEYRRGAL